MTFNFFSFSFNSLFFLYHCFTRFLNFKKENILIKNTNTQFVGHKLFKLHKTVTRALLSAIYIPIKPLDILNAYIIVYSIHLMV